VARRGYFKKKQIRAFNWQAPDLNPIQNVWAIIKNNIFGWASKITKDKEVITMIEDIFSRDKTEKEAIKNCYDSLPYRIENMLNRKGGHC
jgi:hypothetical protein